MPRGDGSGPAGAGPKTGRGLGDGGGAGVGRGQGQGQMGGFSLGPGGQCTCAVCGKTVPHQQGVPCNQMKCPGCGGAMSRQR